MEPSLYSSSVLCLHAGWTLFTLLILCIITWCQALVLDPLLCKASHFTTSYPPLFFYMRKPSVNGAHCVNMAEQSRSPACSPQPVYIIVLEQQRKKKTRASVCFQAFAKATEAFSFKPCRGCQAAQNDNEESSVSEVNVEQWCVEVFLNATHYIKHKSIDLFIQQASPGHKSCLTVTPTIRAIC